MSMLHVHQLHVNIPAIRFMQSFDRTSHIINIIILPVTPPSTPGGSQIASTELTLCIKWYENDLTCTELALQIRIKKSRHFKYQAIATKYQSQLRMEIRFYRRVLRSRLSMLLPKMKRGTLQKEITSSKKVSMNLLLCFKSS